MSIDPSTPKSGMWNHLEYHTLGGHSTYGTDSQFKDELIINFRDGDLVVLVYDPALKPDTVVSEESQGNGVQVEHHLEDMRMTGLSCFDVDNDVRVPVAENQIGFPAQGRISTPSLRRY